MHLPSVFLAGIAAVTMLGAAHDIAAAAEIAGASKATNDAPDFITLGTMGGPVGESGRSQPANLIAAADGAWFVDVGDGAVQQMTRAGYHLPQVRGVFISHLHFDHIGGLSALIGLRHQSNAPGVLQIYGPPGTLALVDGLLASMAPSTEAGFGLPGAVRVDPATTVKVHELRDNDTVALAGMNVTVAKNTHYSFHPGSEEDKKFESLAFRFDFPARSILFTGDTGPSERVVALGKGADLLVTEMIDVPATVAAVQRINPKLSQANRDSMTKHLSAHHVNPTQVGEMATAMGVKKIVATHLVVTGADAARRQGYIDEIKV